MKTYEIAKTPRTAKPIWIGTMNKQLRVILLVAILYWSLIICGIMYMSARNNLTAEDLEISIGEGKYLIWN